MRLTKTLVEGVEPQPRDRYLWDGQLAGFGVKVTPSGRRIYLVQYRPKGGRSVRRYTLGRHGDPWTAERAREAARDLLARIRLGEDPFQADRAKRAAEAAEVKAVALQLAAAHNERARLKRDAFPVVVERFVSLHAKPNNRSWSEAQRILTSSDVVRWAARSVGSIERREVLELVDEVTGRAPGAGRLLFAHLRRFFGWCTEKLIIESSPCNGLRSPPLPRPRDRVLADIELQHVWTASAAAPRPFGPLLQLLILTGQRRSEVTAMRWDELDLAAAEWIIPAERAKNGSAHAVDLSEPALAILKQLYVQRQTLKTRVSGRSSGQKVDDDLVFTTTGRTPVSGHAKVKSGLDARIAAIRAQEGLRAMAPWRLHDLRRTAATGMARLGFAPHVIEAVLNHRSGARGGLVAVYQHYDHRPARQRAMETWGSHVAALMSET